MKDLKLTVQLTLINVKMFMRDKGALFWSLFFPVLIIGIFGVFDFASMGNYNIGLVYSEDTQVYADQLEKIFDEGEHYKVYTGPLNEELVSLENDDRLIVIEFAQGENSKVQVNTYVGKENEQAGEIITLVTEKILADISLKMQNIELPFEVNRQIINTNNLRFIDYIVPGVIALAVMQGALFGVVGAIVVNRERGVLKRIFATPLKKSVFLTSNIIARTFISLLQIAILLALSYLVFDIQIVGSLTQVAVLATIGSLTFIALGILLSSFAKTAESARAMIMPLQMLFMFTAGVYFSREVLPKWLYDISGFFPLTYLSDILRETMVKGGDLGNSVIQTGTIGLVIWLVILVGLSIVTFKWNGDE